MKFHYIYFLCCKISWKLWQPVSSKTTTATWLNNNSNMMASCACRRTIHQSHLASVKRSTFLCTILLSAQRDRETEMPSQQNNNVARERPCLHNRGQFSIALCSAMLFHTPARPPSLQTVTRKPCCVPYLHNTLFRIELLFPEIRIPAKQRHGFDQLFCCMRWRSKRHVNLQKGYKMLQRRLHGKNSKRFIFVHRF